VNTLPAGSRILFARGGSWTAFNLYVYNRNATTDQPLVFDSYASSWDVTTPPLLQTSTDVAFRFGGSLNDTVSDGGYVLRNVKLDGLGTAEFGVFASNRVHDLQVDSVEITRHGIGFYSQNTGTAAPSIDRPSEAVHGNVNITLRNSLITRNYRMGLLGDADGFFIENNRFVANNDSGSNFNHAIYLSGFGRNGQIRNNTFTNNSAVNGECLGGNVTVHGKWNGLLIEGNTMTQQSSAMSCYGISINGGYDTPEWFGQVVVRGNVIVNLGGCSICVTSSPGIVIENNLVVNNLSGYHAGIVLGGYTASNDVQDNAGIIRNNSIYLVRNATTSEGIRAIAGTSLQVVSNLVYFGPENSAYRYCFRHNDRSTFLAFDNNLCYHAGSGGMWSLTYSLLSGARAGGFDLSGVSADPLFVTVPSAANGWNEQLQAGSPARAAGHPTRSSTTDRLGATRTAINIGSR
jgi:hypothetical protein